jgi:hypothetical protein
MRWRAMTDKVGEYTQAASDVCLNEEIFTLNISPLSADLDLAAVEMEIDM